MTSIIFFTVARLLFHAGGGFAHLSACGEPPRDVQAARERNNSQRLGRPPGRSCKPPARYPLLSVAPPTQATPGARATARAMYHTVSGRRLSFIKPFTDLTSCLHQRARSHWRCFCAVQFVGVYMGAHLCFSTSFDEGPSGPKQIRRGDVATTMALIGSRNFSVEKLERLAAKKISWNCNTSCFA